jgi:hypothetical protein
MGPVLVQVDKLHFKNSVRMYMTINVQLLCLLQLEQSALSDTFIIDLCNWPLALQRLGCFENLWKNNKQVYAFTEKQS